MQGQVVEQSAAGRQLSLGPGLGQQPPAASACGHRLAGSSSLPALLRPHVTLACTPLPLCAQMVLCLEAYGADVDLGSGMFHQLHNRATPMAAARALFDKCGLHQMSKT